MSETGWLLVAIAAAMAGMWFLGWLSSRQVRMKKGAGPKPWLRKRTRRH